MTMERRIVVDLDDVAALRIQCSNCKGEVVLRPDSRQGRFMPESCPVCRTEWMDSTGSMESRLVDLIYRIRDADPKPKPARLLLEISNDGSGGS